MVNRIRVHRDFEIVLDDFKKEMVSKGWPRLSTPQASRLFAKKYLDLRCGLSGKKKLKKFM